jgi:MFS family permease
MNAPPRRARRLPNPWASLRGLPRDVWMLCAATLINRAGSMALLFLVLYLTGRGWSTRDAGLVVSVFGIGSMIASPVAGRLCDRIGARRVVLGSLCLSGIIMILYPLVHGFAATLVMTLLWSFTGESFRPASFTLISHAVPPAKRRAAFAALRLAVNVGASSGPAGGGFLARVSMPALFLVDGVTALAAWVVLWATGRRRGALATSMDTSRTRDASAADTDAEAIEAAALAAPAPLPVVVTPRAHPLGHFGDRRFVQLLVCMVLLTTVFFQVLSMLSLDLVRGQGMSESTLGLLYALNALLVVLFEVPLSARFAPWRGPRVMALGALLIAAGVGSTAWAHDALTAALTVVVWSFGEMLLFPSGSAYVAEITTAERRGEAMGLYTAATSAGFILAPLLGTRALERWGADAAWAGACAVGCIAAAMLLRLDAPPPADVPSSGSSAAPRAAVRA